MRYTLEIDGLDVNDVLGALAERRDKHTKLAAVASKRSGKLKYSRNAAELNTKHRQRAEKAGSIIENITRQL